MLKLVGYFWKTWDILQTRLGKLTLTLSLLGKISAEDMFKYFSSLFFPEKALTGFSHGDNLHEMSSPVYGDNLQEMSEPASWEK